MPPLLTGARHMRSDRRRAPSSPTSMPQTACPVAARASSRRGSRRGAHGAPRRRAPRLRAPRRTRPRPTARAASIPRVRAQRQPPLLEHLWKTSPSARASVRRARAHVTPESDGGRGRRRSGVRAPRNRRRRRRTRPTRAPSCCSAALRRPRCEPARAPVAAEASRRAVRASRNDAPRARAAAEAAAAGSRCCSSRCTPTARASAARSPQRALNDLLPTRSSSSRDRLPARGAARGARRPQPGVGGGGGAGGERRPSLLMRTRSSRSKRTRASSRRRSAGCTLIQPSTSAAAGSTPRCGRASSWRQDECAAQPVIIASRPCCSCRQIASAAQDTRARARA